MRNIGIIFGGKSPEYKVSLESVTSVLKEIDRSKYNPVVIGITRDGTWYYYKGDLEKIVLDTWVNQEDCLPAILSPNPKYTKLLVFESNEVKSIHLDALFPILHGSNGEDGTLQGYIGLTNIPLIGCGVLASSLCMDKYRSHLLVEKEGIACAKGKVFDRNSLNDIESFCDEIEYPSFIKPVHAGSSFGITKVNTREELAKAIDVALEYDKKILVEECIHGFEVGCAIVGYDTLLTGEVDEVELFQGFFNHEEKYTLKSSVIHVPARISKEKENEVKEISKRIYKLLGCSAFARVDCFINDQNDVIFNEINTIPGFTSHSRFPTMLKAAGFTFQEIITLIIEETFNNETN